MMALLPDTLAAEALELRRWHPRYAEGLCAAVSASLPALRPWMPWAQEEPTVGEHMTILTEGDAKFEAGTEWQFVLVEPDGDRVVGAAGLHHPQRHLVQQLHLGQFAAQHRGGERGGIDRAAQGSPQMRDRADMVFMGMGDDQADQPVAPLGDEAGVGHHDIDLGVLGTAEADAAIHS